jgi:hypothetical protein
MQFVNQICEVFSVAWKVTLLHYMEKRQKQLVCKFTCDMILDIGTLGFGIVCAV